MFSYSLLEPEGVLILTPDAPLKQEDFAGLTTTVDAYLAKHGKLHGALVYAEKFPGWEDVSGFTSHMHFVREHRNKVERIAVIEQFGRGEPGDGSRMRGPAHTPWSGAARARWDHRHADS